MKDILERAARGEKVERPPVWLMRQAGRYIPEYREIREEYTFKEAIKTPEVAEKITLLPWDIFEPDGLVIYSDILTVIEPLGFDYEIESGVGPVIDSPVETGNDVSNHELESGFDPTEEFGYVGELLERLNGSVGNETSIIGFSGAPFTLASYLIDSSPRDKTAVRGFRAQHPDAFERLLSNLEEVVVEYVEYQQRKGADVIQLFDTWSGLLSPDDYREFALPHQRRIIDEIDIPSIMFTRNSGGKLSLLEETGADVVSVDWTVDIGEAKRQLGTVQGNLDPAYLLSNPDFVKRETRKMLDKTDGVNHIANLGHGVQKNTPVENVQAFVEAVKEY